MEKVFETLFKYRPFFFSEGDFHFRTVVPAWLILLLLAGALAFVVAIYYGPLRSRGHRGLVLALLKTSAVLLVLLLLAQPALRLSRVVPRESLVAVLVDNSASLGILADSIPRGRPVVDLVQPDSSFRQSLGENFQVRWNRFSRGPESLRSAEELDWKGDQTNLSAALSGVLAESRSLPFAGVVLVTDGADNSFRDLTTVVNAFAANGIPIHTVGVGPERYSRDIEVSRVSLPGEVLPDSVAVARVQLEHPGFRGARVQLRVRDGNTLVASREVQLAPGADQTIAEVNLFPEVSGTKVYQFSVDPLAGEEITENNTRRAIFQVRDKQPRVLLVEGRPRWEYKFIRQALSQDRFLRLESLLRTAINKYYRQGIEEETSLAAGFPTTREDLFSYQGLVIGDVESAFFNYSQLEMIRDFVSRRGGGLLMLGGGSTLASGGYENTPIEEVLPVWLSASGRDFGESYERREAGAALTEYGVGHPALRLSREEGENEEIWARLPNLTDRNRVGGAKPGATILLRSGDGGDGGSGEDPLLVSHRFGRGLALAFLSGSSWRWQMLQDSTDMSHQRFWRQLLRWLISSARDRVDLEVERGVYAQNEPVRLRVEVNDKTYTRVNDARVVARITPPEGEQVSVPLSWSAREDGVYVAEWFPVSDGVHRVSVEAAAPGEGGESLGLADGHFLVDTGATEYFGATRRASFLQNISRQTGGRYYDIRDAGNLPEEIGYVRSEAAVTEVLDLWNMPINFLLLAALLSVEWILRRRWGLV